MYLILKGPPKRNFIAILRLYDEADVALYLNYTEKGIRVWGGGVEPLTSSAPSNTESKSVFAAASFGRNYFRVQSQFHSVFNLSIVIIDVQISKVRLTKRVGTVPIMCIKVT